MTLSALDSARLYQGELSSIRRDIHAHPELGLEEFRTAALVARKLREWGIEVHSGVGKTGVVGVLQNGSGQAAIGLRADMDALPMQEATGLPHASKNPGRMHACGHDGHTAILLGAAKYLAESRDFSGTVNFIFQPAEEGRGGAQEMLDDNLFQRFPCDAIFGLHNSPGLPVGWFAAGYGARMAGAAFFDITVIGMGAHGARPQESIDPVIVACHIATALQTVISRTISAQDTAVLSITQIRAGDAYNVIPHHAVLGGTVRTLESNVMATIEHTMKRLAAGIAEGFGAEAVVAFRNLFVPLVNDYDEATIYADAAVAVVGEAKVLRNSDPIMASEDFALMMQVVPGAHVMFGNGHTAAVHNQMYDFNDESIPFGVALLAAITEKKLPRG